MQKMITRLRKIDMANIDVTSCVFASKTRYARQLIRWISAHFLLWVLNRSKSFWINISH